MYISQESVWDQLTHNRVLTASGVSWFVAHSCKVLIGVIEEKRFNFKWFVGSGGMPSSHTAFVMAAAVSIGIRYGYQSDLFAAVAVFAFVTMFDAQGVRRHSGKQAEALNRIFDDIYAHRELEWEPLKELFGHTPLEVIAGALIGIFTALLFAG